MGGRVRPVAAPPGRVLAHRVSRHDRQATKSRPSTSPEPVSTDRASPQHADFRSEERRVGKEGRTGLAPQLTKKTERSLQAHTRPPALKHHIWRRTVH